MRTLAAIAAASILLTAAPAVAGAEPTYCYAAKPGGESGCFYKAPLTETVTLTGFGGWRVFYKHKKKVTTYTNPTPEVPTTFAVDMHKGDTLTLEAFHIGSGIVLVTNE